MARTIDSDVLLLAAAADPTRLGMLRQLALGGAVCACEFTAGSSLRQPTVSHHLKVLRDSGWVNTERRGTWIWYSLRPEAVQRFERLAATILPTGGHGARRLPVLNEQAAPSS